MCVYTFEGYTGGVFSVHDDVRGRVYIPMNANYAIAKTVILFLVYPSSAHKFSLQSVFSLYKISHQSNARYFMPSIVIRIVTKHD